MLPDRAVGDEELTRHRRTGQFTEEDADHRISTLESTSVFGIVLQTSVEHHRIHVRM